MSRKIEMTKKVNCVLCDKEIQIENYKKGNLYMCDDCKKSEKEKAINRKYVPQCPECGSMQFAVKSIDANIIDCECLRCQTEFTAEGLEIAKDYIVNVIQDLYDSTSGIEGLIRQRIKKIGTGEAAKLTKEKQQNLSQFIAGDRKYSLKKLKEISEKIL